MLADGATSIRFIGELPICDTQEHARRPADDAALA
jgi:hypothetical protein